MSRSTGLRTPRLDRGKLRGREALLETPEWRELLESLPVLRSFFAGDPGAHGITALLHGVSIYLERLFDSIDRGAPCVWYNLGFNPELVYALGDAQPITIEMLGVMHNLLGNLDRSLAFIDRAEAEGAPGDCCSADKLAAGAMHLGLYPSPACTVGINTPCDAQVMGTQVMAELGRAPFFAVDVPYYHNEETVRHVAAQLRLLVPFLEEHTRRRLDIDRLREVCRLSNQMTETLWEWLDWRKLVPLTQSSKLVAFTLVLQILFTGTEEGLAIARGLLQEARERQERGERFFEERCRAIWYQDPVWTDMQIYDWFERDLGLTVPVDVFGFYAHTTLIDTSSLDSMLEGLARKLVNCHPMARQFRSDIDVYIQDFLHLHEAWRADCGIFAGHVACKHAWGGIGLFKEACRRAGIPLLVFEFDMFDPRVTSYDDIFFQVERFVNEVVLPRKARGRG
ncbi:MAG: 2-hydroxyacyl-CoA dehydratase family protein [Polyangia bacterium]|jgi:benzoyl-CoA reductase/2-hydroxyglutaryl-CoA dehydratase subunit BcrC/BadD/HgdB|nr:2-hydroxyacyl-CoA dehydratase family protein [Polyangia bacterium]